MLQIVAAFMWFVAREIKTGFKRLARAVMGRRS